MIKSGETSDCMQDVIRKVHEYVQIQHTYLVASIDDDMRSAEEVGDRTGVGVEETFTGDGNAVTAPVDLDELGQLALRWRFSDASAALTASTLRSDPSRAQRRTAS